MPSIINLYKTYLIDLTNLKLLPEQKKTASDSLSNNIQSWKKKLKWFISNVCIVAEGPEVLFLSFIL